MTARDRDWAAGFTVIELIVVAIGAQFAGVMVFAYASNVSAPIKTNSARQL